MVNQTQTMQQVVSTQAQSTQQWVNLFDHEAHQDSDDDDERGGAFA